MGVLAEPSYATFEHLLGDDVVVLFTDGVVEARQDRELFGLERLLELGRGPAATSRRSPRRSWTAALEFQDGNPRDDIAVVTLQGEPRRSAADTLPA